MTIATEVRKLATDKLIELFILDTTPIGGNTLDYFHSGTSLVNAPIVFQGQTYTPWALKVEGFEKSGTGALPQPTLTVGNPQGIMSRTVLQLKDLVGAKLLRKRTFAKFLDAVNFPSDDWALSLNGATEVVLPQAPQFVLAGGSWAVEARAALASLPNPGWQQILGGEGGCIAVGYSAAHGFSATLTSLADAEVGANVTPLIGQEYHVVVSYDAATKRISFYVNGTLTNTAIWDYSGVLQANRHSNVIGNSHSYGANFNGKLRHVRVYQKALSALQISSAYSAGSTFGPVASYECEEHAGAILHDNVSGLNGVMAEGAKFSPRSFTNPTADPSQEFPVDVFFIIQKTKEVPTEVEFKIASAIDLEGLQIPLRPLVQNACQWRYRSAECSWTGGYFDKHDEPCPPQQDQCGKRISSCKVRFGANAVLPFGGFPGARRYS